MKANEALKSLNCASNQLTSLDVRNGHNTQITEFDATNNSSLNCISVDDANYSTVNWTNIDAHTSFNGDCYFIADFVADETSGPLPLEVQFTDRSDNTATSWQWTLVMETPARNSLPITLHRGGYLHGYAHDKQWI
jgi:PKD repeat protein